jgi:hypothetical protein
MAKPVDDARWADVGGNITEPSEAKKDVGFQFGEEPASSFANWVWWNFGKWITFLYDEMLSPIITDAGALKTDAVTTASIGDDQVTLAKLAGGGADLVFGTNNSGDPELALLSTNQIASGAVDSSKISNRQGLSVFGRAASGAGVGADIIAAFDDRVLARAGSALVWVQVNTAKIADNAVGDTKLRNSAAVSVIGRSVNSGGDPADIAAGANDRILARQSDALAFVQATEGMLADNAVPNTKLANMSTIGVKGRSIDSVGDPQDVNATINDRVLSRSSDLLAFTQVSTAMLADGAVTESKTAGAVARWVAGAQFDVAAAIALGTNKIGRAGEVVIGAATATQFGAAYIGAGETELTCPTGTDLEDYTFSFDGQGARIVSLVRTSSTIVRVQTRNLSGTLTDTDYHFQALRVT